LGWPVIVAWLVAAICALLATRSTRRLQRVKAPEAAALLAELQAEVGASDAHSEFARRAAIAELNQRLADVSFELDSLPTRLTALTRICLASGTGLALFAYIGEVERTALERVLTLAACAAGGLVGTVSVALIGRMAKQQSRQIREGWDRSSREAGKALGTSLASVAAKSHAGRVERAGRSG